MPLYAAREWNFVVGGSMRDARTMQRRQRGVTRIELMATLAAALLVASIAIPAFTGYVERSRVSRAVSDIGTTSLQLHRWQRDNGALPATLAEVGLSGTDPWGRPYVYVRVAGANKSQLRKDGDMAPINTDFDLYSMGADGETAAPLPAQKSRDDVVRAADGSYIGLAINY
jgi:general secretion pathway protein G